MTDTLLVEPDLDFKARILGLGAHDLTACYQCGTCSVVCPISTPLNPFPRKEMVWTQWGLKDLALSNSSIWLCHQCAACTAYCPRNAHPAAVMAALREYSISHYAVPRFMGEALTHPKYLPLLAAIPALVFAAILASLGHLTTLPEGPVVYSKFMPIPYVEGTFIAALTLSLAGAICGGIRYWKAMDAHSRKEGGSRRALLPTLRGIFAHRAFKECGEPERPTHKEHLHKTHLLVFYGFLGLVVTTASVGIGIYAFGYLTPWPLWHPVKILGNASGLAVIAALAIFIYRRAADGRSGTGAEGVVDAEGGAARNTYADRLFLGVLLLAAVTGFLCELLRLGGIRELAYPAYFVHLVIIFFLLVYAPYSKLAHVIYRTVAMVHQ